MNSKGPRLIFWEITRRCNLKCPYCRREYYHDKGLALESAIYIIDSIAEAYRTLVVFSGGEPLLYPYIFEAASYAKKKGLTTALATNGTLIDKAMARRIEQCGFHRVAVSLDSADEAVNDSLRGKGTFSKVMEGLHHLRAQGIPTQINATILKRNFKEVLEIYELCVKLGIEALHLFAFVPVGCGIDIPNDERLSCEEYEKFLEEVADLSLRAQIEIKLTCAPHYQRILSQRHKIRPAAKGCLAGSGVCFISGAGEVYPCGYLTLSAGNIYKEGFKDIWEGNGLFRTLRNIDCLKGKCGICEYIDVCGGCRARAYAKTGDYLEEEPDCAYQPLKKRF